MTKLTTWIAITITWIATCTGVHAQPQSASAPSFTQNTPNTLRLLPDTKGASATIKDIAWLQGRWVGDGLGGAVEEIWAPPALGQMMGVFRYERDGKIVFYEFLTLAEQENSLALRVKHFNPDMVGWEEKDKFVTFRFIKFEGERAYFSGFTFERLGNDGWIGFLAMRQSDGNVREVKFTFRRAPL